MPQINLKLNGLNEASDNRTDLSELYQKVGSSRFKESSDFLSNYSTDKSKSRNTIIIVGSSAFTLFNLLAKLIPLKEKLFDIFLTVTKCVGR
jgi:hypothetical protein